MRFPSHSTCSDLRHTIWPAATTHTNRLPLMLAVSTVAHLAILCADQHDFSFAEKNYFSVQQQGSRLPLQVSFVSPSLLHLQRTAPANTAVDLGDTTTLKSNHSMSNHGLHPSELSPPPITPLEPEYIPVSELSTKPKLLGELAMDNIALLTGETERRSAQFELMISEYGHVDQIEINQSDFPESVAQTMLSMLKLAQFSPGKIGSTPVRSRFRIEFTFEPNVN